MRDNINWIEKKFSYKAIDKEPWIKGMGKRPLKSGDHVVVVGGGIAGSAFVRRLLFLCAKEKKAVKITLINSTSCNYCGGLITDLALNTFKNVYELDVPEGVVLTRIKGFSYVNSRGSFDIRINIPLIGMLRTSRFGVLGFDESFKKRIMEGLPSEIAEYLTVIEPTIVTHITPQEPGKKPWKITLSRRIEGEKIELMADFMVLAGGLKMVETPLLKEFAEFTGYQAPPLMPASVTEIDTSKAKVNITNDKLYVLDNIIPGAVIGLVSKGENWLTLTSLGKELNKEDLDYLFSHPEVKKHLDLPHISEYLRCGIICKARVYTGPTKNFYGDNWAAIGDLNGYGRVLKDGYQASLLSAKLVADNIVYTGTDKESLHRNYFLHVDRLRLDNKIGMMLFNANNRLNQNKIFNRYFVKSAQIEIGKNEYGGSLHSAIRALMTGELPYRWIAFLFFIGLFRRLLTPWQFFKKKTE
ncbi:MAG: hypothetical protein JM58_19085 [Peptococcaceae bacterium BICA1-8]|nr:MAG: hypothetical protein JM58_19085 [Peptococcaceae bacterium BICA1-8]